MYFNENKYKKCISHLVTLKTCIVLGYMVLFSAICAGIGLIIMQEFFEDQLYVIGISTGIGALLGLIVGLSSTWSVEMKIQEAYWRMDILNEIKTQTSIANKNTPIAKTVVAIENKQNPPTPPIPPVLSEEKKEEIQQ